MQLQQAQQAQQQQQTQQQQAQQFKNGTAGAKNGVAVNAKQFNPNVMMTTPTSMVPGGGPNSRGNSQGHTPQMGNQPQPQLQPGQQQQQQIFQIQPQTQSIPLNGAGPANITPIMPQQQQPTPQSQPRAGPAQKSIPMSVPAGDSPHLKNNGNPMVPNGINGNVNGQPSSAPTPSAGGSNNAVGTPGKTSQIPPLTPQQQQQQQLQLQQQQLQQQQQQQQELQNELNAKIFKKNLGNTGIVRVLDMIDQISNESLQILSTIEYWQRLTAAFLTPNAILRFTNSVANSFTPMNNPNVADINKTGHNRQFELNPVTAARFFLACVLAQDLENFHVSLPGIKFQILNNGSIFIASKLTIQSTYADDSSATISGSIKLLMNRDFRIEWVDINCMQYQPSIKMSGIEKNWNAFLGGRDLSKFPLSGDSQREFFKHIYDNSLAFSNGFNSGLDETSMRVLNVGDVMTHLKSLMIFSISNNLNSPVKAMEHYMTSNFDQQRQLLLQQQQKQQMQHLQMQQHELQQHQQQQQQQQLQEPQPGAPSWVKNGVIGGTSSSPSPSTTELSDPKAAGSGPKKRKVSVSGANGGPNSTVKANGNKGQRRK